MESDLNTKLMKAWTAWRLMLAAMIASFTVGWALAEESDSEASSEYFEEVLFTAERVESNILDTPMTITALNSDMLQQLGVQDRDKLQNLVHRQRPSHCASVAGARGLIVLVDGRHGWRRVR